MRRGNDLLRALDAVQFYKGQEYDKLRNELLWQKRRFSRVSVIYFDGVCWDCMWSYKVILNLCYSEFATNLEKS